MDEKRRIAEDINFFLGTVSVPNMIRVTPDDIELMSPGAKVTKSFAGVKIAVELDNSSLLHIAAIRGLIGSWQPKE